MKNVLFICGQNRLRSPTAEHIYASYPGIEVSSGGLKHDADNPVTPELLQWADLIFVMEDAHRRKLQQQFRRDLNGKRIICLRIPDRYAYMDPELIRELQKKLTPHLPMLA